MEKGDGDATAVAEKKAKNKSVILPFVQGGLTGFLTASVPWLGLSLLHNVAPQDLLPHIHFINKRFPALLFTVSTSTASQFGSFETYKLYSFIRQLLSVPETVELRSQVESMKDYDRGHGFKRIQRIFKQILEAANHGRELTLYQGASCGMAAGAVESIFCCPIRLACRRVEANANMMSVQQSYFRNILLDLGRTTMDKGFLALYRGGGRYTALAIGYNTGMFASYGRSVSYFKESWGLNESSSQLRAAFVSGFCASACSLPFINLPNAIKAVQENEKSQCKSFFDCTMKSFKICDHKILYKGLMNHLLLTAIPIATTLICYEYIGNAFQNWP